MRGQIKHELSRMEEEADLAEPTLREGQSLRINKN